jgi:hypothetical protein
MYVMHGNDQQEVDTKAIYNLLSDNMSMAVLYTAISSAMKGRYITKAVRNEPGPALYKLTTVGTKIAKEIGDWPFAVRKFPTPAWLKPFVEQQSATA